MSPAYVSKVDGRIHENEYSFGYGRGYVCVFTREIFLSVFMSSYVKWGFFMVLNTVPTFFLLHFAILLGF